MNLADIATALLGLGGIAAAVGLVAVAGRDDDGHTIDDYRRPGTFGPVDDVQPADQRRLRPGALAEPGMLPPSRATVPIPASGRSVFAETAAALGVCPVDAGAVVAVVADRYGGSPADRAARMLREIAAEEQAKAGRPSVGSSARPSNEVWSVDRDMTGAFPVVARAA